MLSSYENAKRIAAQSKPVRLARWFKEQAVVRGNGPGIPVRSECQSNHVEAVVLNRTANTAAYATLNGTRRWNGQRK